jgi:hypothetical protein
MREGKEKNGIGKAVHSPLWYLYIPCDCLRALARQVLALLSYWLREVNLKKEREEDARRFMLLILPPLLILLLPSAVDVLDFLGAGEACVWTRRKRRGDWTKGS